MILPLIEVERQVILDAVRCSDNNSAAAHSLGIGKTTLYRKLKGYGERPPHIALGFPLYQARALLTLPRPRPDAIPYLILPSNKKERARAQYKCPACSAVVLLPEKT